MGTAPHGDPTIGLDEEAVANTSRKITRSAEDVHTLHTTTRAMLDDSGSGHVGRSAQELSELSQRWAQTGRRHTERIDTLGRRIGDAGISLSDTDEQGARRIEDVPND